MHIESRKIENDKNSFSLWEWIKEIEDEMAPEKKFKKKTYRITLGQFNPLARPY